MFHNKGTPGERKNQNLAVGLGVLAGAASALQEHFHPPDTYHPEAGMLLWIGLAGGAGLILGLLLRASSGRILMSAIGGAAVVQIVTMLLPVTRGADSLNLFPLAVVVNTGVTAAGVWGGLLLAALCKSFWND